MRKMKDSGIEWIGEIPERWRTVRVKHLATEKDTLFLDGDWINSDVIVDEGIRYLTSGNVGEGFYKEQGKGYISEETFEKLNCLKVYPGDLMISRLNEPVGRCCIVTEDEDYYVVAVDNVILRPNEDISKKFMMYCMNTSGYARAALMAASGTTMQRISRTSLGNMTVPVTDYDEQVRIADYLDQKCAEIDAIIAAKEKTNELLKERRQSIIYEAVTKGLDPTVPMKDSGVEWIGEIPESWSVWRLKHLLCQEKGAIKAGPFGSSITANDMQGGDVKVFTQRTVLDNDFLSGDEYISFDKYEDLKGFSVKTGDILITTRGTIGKTAIVPKSSFGILHPCLIKMSIDSDKINKSLLCRIFNETNIFEEQLRLASNATTIDVIYTQNLLNIFVPLAPLHEQDRICKYLNEKCESLDYLISSNDSTIKKLKEYRQSVIYEAVTGKVEI